MRSTLRRVDCIGLRLNLVVQQSQIGEVVLDFLERNQHLLTILRDIFVILAARLSQIGLATAPVEQRHGQRSSCQRSEQERAA